MTSDGAGRDKVAAIDAQIANVERALETCEKSGFPPYDLRAILASLRELKRIRERKDLQRNVGCARGQNTTQFCAEAVAAQSKLAKVMEYQYRKAMMSLVTPTLTYAEWSAELLRTIEGAGGDAVNQGEMK